MANDVEIKVVLKGNAAKQYSKSMDAIRSQNKKTSDSMKKMGRVSSKSFDTAKRSAMGLKVAIVAISAFALGKLSQAFVKAGSEVEDLTTEFKVLLGSVEDAKKRMEELEQFAQTTPFQLKEVAKASKILETFTKGALSTGDALRMVGDAAAITGEKDFAGLAMWVGRAYDGLQSNRPVGEAMMRLQELALVSGEARGKIEALQKAGKGKQAWTVLEGELMKANGGMKELSKTATGLTSTIKDQMSAAMRQMMETGAWDAFRKQLESITKRLTQALNDGTFTRLGENILSAARSAKKFATFLADAGSSYADFVLKVSGTDKVTKTVKDYQESLEGVDKVLNLLLDAQRANEKAQEKVNQGLSTGDLVKHRDRLIEEANAIRGVNTSYRQSIKLIPALTEKKRELAEAGLTGFDKEIAALDKWDVEMRQKFAGNAAALVEITEQRLAKQTEIEKKYQKPGVAAEGAVVDFQKVQEELQVERQLQLEHQISMLALKDESKEQEVEMERLKFERMAEEGNKGLANTLRRKELEQATIGKIEGKWDKIKEAEDKRQLKLQHAGLQMTTSLMLNNISQLTAGYKSLSGISKAVAVAQATQATYVAATNAYASTAAIPIVGAALAPFAAATAVAAGLANVARIVSAADGGVFDGPISGYPAVLHGNEAVIPLKNGAVPVQIEGGAGGTTIINNYYGSGGENPMLMTEPERLQMLNESNKEIVAMGI